MTSVSERLARILANPRARVRLALGVALLAFAADRLSKYWLFETLGMRAGAHLNPTSFLEIILVWNRGISYGLLDFKHPAMAWALFALGVVICAWLVWMLTRQTSWAGLIGFALVIGGAAGNLYDRAAFGAVADFIHLHGWGYSWYVFNFADAWITLGIVLILGDSFFHARRVKRTTTTQHGNTTDDS